ncbi:hypothetical protein MPSEU_000213600 [Mayamaea pseudoterrestris]|nr:hypothetical protein MPSEU_000213600 [Mayamaea pseudoterrestris]
MRIARSERGFVAIFGLMLFVQCASSFHFILMAPKQGAKKRTRSLADELKEELEGGLGQEITGVTLPALNQLKGWEFGESVRMVCGNVGGKYYALQGNCPRCAFDLWKGDLIVDDQAWEDLPRLACPTCSTTYSMRSGRPGPALKRKGMQAIVSGLTLTSTKSDAEKIAKAFIILKDEDGKVYCRERKQK